MAILNETNSLKSKKNQRNIHYYLSVNMLIVHPLT